MKSLKIKVLYVDDEANNLISFKANFRKFYEIFTAESAKKGKEILKKYDINVIITDQRMPEISGVEFLESIIKSHPYPIRIILTGYSDIETIIEAINKGQIYRYVMKPFNADELKTVIESAYDLFLLRKSSKDALIKFRQLFESVNEVIFIMDLNGNFQELNNFGLNLFKIHRNKLKDITLQELFVDQEEYKTLNDQLLKKEIIIDYPSRLKDFQNKIIETLITITPISEEKKLIGYQCMIRDITKQKEMENFVIKTIIETQDNERIKLGENLHDNIGQKLAAIKLFLNALEKREENLKGNEILIKTHETIAISIEELRGICYKIMPKTLEMLGLKAAISELKKRNQFPEIIEFETKIDSKFPKLDQQLELNIFRIIQAFVSNTMLHSQAKKIEIILFEKANTVHMILKDDGKGFHIDKDLLGSGSGLKSIISRVQSYNGTIEMKSQLNQGTQFTISLPPLNYTVQKKKSALN